MKSKLIILTVSVAMGISVLTGCTTKPATPETPPASVESDVVSGASRANDEATFIDKISADGNFIIITSKDLTFTEDLVVDGRFTKEGSDVAVRSLALAAYTEDGKEIDKRFTVTVPRIVINSENTLLEYGIIKGDVYVQAEGFRTADATIDGNLYFATEELKDAFAIDETTKVNGEIGVCKYTE